jgi:predicted protein tyrosine phosphatase
MEPDGGKLYLGTEAFAFSEGGLASLGITHRLSCLMTREEEVEWLAYAAEGTDTLAPPQLAFSVMHADATDDSNDTPATILARCPMADEDAFAPFAPELLANAAKFLDDALRAGGTVYVHCSHGVSRSPTAVLWFLVNYRGRTLQEAATQVKTQRRKVRLATVKLVLKRP